MYKAFPVEGGYEVFWCPSAPQHYADKIPYDGRIRNKSAAHMQARRLNGKIATPGRLLLKDVLDATEHMIQEDVPHVIVLHMDDLARSYVDVRQRLAVFLQSYQIYLDRIYVVRAVYSYSHDFDAVALSIHTYVRKMPSTHRTDYAIVSCVHRFVLTKADFTWVNEEVSDIFYCEGHKRRGAKRFYTSNMSKHVYETSAITHESYQI